MKIKVDYIETKPEKIKMSFKEAGRKGGLAKVKKGFACMDKDRLRKLSKEASEKRWRCEK